MDLLERNQLQKTIIQTASLTTLIALVGLMISLILGSTRLSGVTTNITVFSPLGLFELHKAPLSTGGYEASIRALTHNLIWYTLTWLTVTILIIVWRLANQNKQS